ncbi:mitochondrial-processing peptidase subunit alpha-like isoform X1 [Durio zibethinus]|uniref:Complex III subunit II n=1 Tax=Durio zibethinus TaxID=66656 RepID=A0A6P5ZBN9_DURZI|nr:mitochondrial-processing peptidase subunit alpha-like isoform X1 [Durio zibethinus]
MYRNAASRLRALKGRTCRRAPARFASSSAVTTTSSSSGGFLSWLTGSQSKSIPSLDLPLPGVVLPPSLPDYVEPSKTKITSLPNGLKIASETSASPAASIGLYVDCGSIYESPASFGVSHLLECMAFKTTTNRSHLRIVREVEAIGGNVNAAVSREQIGYTFDALKTYVPEMVELLIDCVRNPVFLDWEVNEQIQKVKEEIAEAAKNPHGLLLEAIHSAGYSGALANPLLAPESAVNILNGTVLDDFVVENFTASRMVLAATGVEHEELLSVAEPLLSDLPNVPHPQEPKSVYTGGDYRCQADSRDQTHFALAFELPGGWHKEKEAIILTVLQVFNILMGGGGSFSAGGPGKGMYSRLYLRVLNEYPQVQSFSAFNSIYNHTGIFGIQATTGSDFVPTAVDVAVKELIAVATPGQVEQKELDRAKQSTKSAILMNLESRMVASEDIGKQILTYGERKPVEHFLKAVDEITLKDISSVAQKLLSSPLTMASYGNVINVPTYDSVSSKCKGK